MAFVIDDQQQQNQAGAPGTPGQAGTMPGQAPVTTTSAPGAGPAKGTGTPGGVADAQTKPFQNLQAYLTANAPQINNQGDKIAGQLTDQYGQAQNAVNTAQQGVQGQVQAGTTAPNQALIDSAAANPTQFVQDPNNVTAFQQQLAGGYTGPQNMEGTDYYANAAKAVTDAVSKAGQVGTTSGLSNYVKGLERNPTAGESLLDTVLLQGNPGAMQKVQAAAKPFAGLNDYLGQATTNTDAGIQKAISDAQTQAKAVQDRFTGAGGVVPTWEKSITDNVAAQQQNAQTRAALDQQVLTTQGFPAGTTPAQMEQVAADFGMPLATLQAYLADVGTAEKGFNPPAGSPVSAVAGVPFDLNNFATFQTPQFAINNANTATAQDYAEEQALQLLLGQNLGFLNPADASKAGTASTDLLDFSTPQNVQDQISQIVRQIALDKAQTSGLPGGVLGIS